MEWQPIETAPRDGSDVIIAGKYRQHWNTFVEVSFWDPRGWWHARKLDDVTHWMPMPTHPDSTSS